MRKWYVSAVICLTLFSLSARYDPTDTGAPYSCMFGVPGLSLGIPSAASPGFSCPITIPAT